MKLTPRVVLIEACIIAAMLAVLWLMLWGATSLVGCQRKAETWARAMEKYNGDHK